MHALLEPSLPPSPFTPDAAFVEPEDGAARLVAGLLAREACAVRALVEEFTPYLTRVLARMTGARGDIDDMRQEVFLRALERIGGLRTPSALRGWLASIAVNVARETLRARRRREWLSFFAPEEMPDIADDNCEADQDATATLRATYQVLSSLSADAQIAFTLRYIEGLELTEVAAACGVSLATIKRRIADATKTFLVRSRSHPALRERLEEESLWAKT